MTKQTIILISAALFILTACNIRPKGVLSSSDMEDVLYDYHLAQGIVTNMPQSENKSKMANAYINSVYDKHGITSEEFDSSMVWYNRNAKDLEAIYKNLHERFKTYNEELQLISGSNEMTSVYSANKDTTNIWGGEKLYVLRANELQNKETFTIKADSNFHKRDKFIFTANIDFIKENKDDRNCNLYMSMSIRYKDKRNVGIVRSISNTNSANLSLEAIRMEEIEAISGYFYYQGSKDSRNIAIVKDIALRKIHNLPETKKSVPVAEEQKKDSIEEAVKNKVEETVIEEEHLSPDELRKQNQNEKRIKIKSAPDKRTPNSFGPSRRRPARQEMKVQN